MQRHVAFGKMLYLLGREVSPDRVEAPARANILRAGAIIAASLLTGLRSDLPGQVTAQVTAMDYRAFQMRENSCSRASSVGLSLI
jgi:hypothetical protein